MQYLDDNSTILENIKASCSMVRDIVERTEIAALRCVSIVNESEWKKSFISLTNDVFCDPLSLS